MKKILSLILVLMMALTCLFTFAACQMPQTQCTNHVDANNDGKCDTCQADMPATPPACTTHVDSNTDGKCDTCGATVQGTTPEPEPEKKDIYTIIKDSKPTKTVTEVEYKVGKDVLDGRYVMEVAGENSTFRYEYERLADPITDGLNGEGRIVTVKGFVFYKDGKYSTDGVTYGAVAPTTEPLSFNLTADKLTKAELSKDGKTLTGELTAQAAEAVLGTDLNAHGNILITVTTEGTYLRSVVLNYTTESGATVSIDTSYSYAELTLDFSVAE